MSSYMLNSFPSVFKFVLVLVLIAFSNIKTQVFLWVYNQSHYLSVIIYIFLNFCMPYYTGLSYYTFLNVLVTPTSQKLEALVRGAQP